MSSAGGFDKENPRRGLTVMSSVLEAWGRNFSIENGGAF
jgi:hypothetical protein